ncbi:MAG: hypothetical protein ACREX3_16825 [Gammaproteobacteria bacterium]
MPERIDQGIEAVIRNLVIFQCQASKPVRFDETNFSITIEVCLAATDAGKEIAEVIVAAAQCFRCFLAAARNHIWMRGKKTAARSTGHPEKQPGQRCGRELVQMRCALKRCNRSHSKK